MKFELIKSINMRLRPFSITCYSKIATNKPQNMNY